MKYLSRFLEVYGRPFRDVIPERDSRPNLTQALHMLAGSTYTEGLAVEGSRIDRLVKAGASNDAVLDELYLAALTRTPTKDERDRLLPMLKDGSAGPEDRKKTLEDLLWAIVASREFAYNH